MCAVVCGWVSKCLSVCVFDVFVYVHEYAYVFVTLCTCATYAVFYTITPLSPHTFPSLILIMLYLIRQERSSWEQCSWNRLC